MPLRKSKDTLVVVAVRRDDVSILHRAVVMHRVVDAVVYRRFRTPGIDAQVRTQSLPSSSFISTKRILSHSVSLVMCRIPGSPPSAFHGLSSLVSLPLHSPSLFLHPRRLIMDRRNGAVTTMVISVVAGPVVVAVVPIRGAGIVMSVVDVMFLRARLPVRVALLLPSPSPTPILLHIGVVLGANTILL
ncbi:hypothetical protein FA13DRAFT_817756 [Coprinellus micaceus]|uniref:Uncharacterized protein n=1 Tax=Coprinellus micaceus TaxID=71717 RepID=A0A4Y7T2S0_COPMI|nr:hypothetical protein FA13DRAFT_817756 [Coprinellus micaceus]